MHNFQQNLHVGAGCRILHIPQNTVDMTSVSQFCFHMLPLYSLLTKVNLNPPLCSGFYGVFIHVLWLLQQHSRGGRELLVQHPSGVSPHCCLLLHLLFHVYHCTVSPSIRFSIINQDLVCVRVYFSEITRMTFKSLSREFSHLDLHLWSLP